MGGAGGVCCGSECVLRVRALTAVACAVRSRMYRNKYPDVEETVFVLVKRIDVMGVYVSLLEYDETEGMILLSELSRRRIRSVKKLVRAQQPTHDSQTS